MARDTKMQLQDPAYLVERAQVDGRRMQELPLGWFLTNTDRPEGVISQTRIAPRGWSLTGQENGESTRKSKDRFSSRFRAGGGVDAGGLLFLVAFYIRRAPYQRQDNVRTTVDVLTSQRHRGLAGNGKFLDVPALQPVGAGL